MATIIDYNGKLAVTFGWATNWDKPQMERTIVVSRAKMEDWKHLRGCRVEFTGNQGRVQCLGATRPTYLDTTDWERVVEVKPIKKPRDSKNWYYEYHSGRWQKYRK